MLLVYPDYTDRDVKGKVSGGNYSEGLASISAVLKQGGHQVELLHLLYLHEEAEFKEKLREKGKFDVIGFSIRTTAFPDAQLYIRWTREVWPLTPESEALLDLLARAGIWFGSAEEAAAKANQVWEDPVSWWRSAAVQDARRACCALQAMMVKGSENPYWTQTLTKL